MASRGVYRGIYCSMIDRLADERRSPEERHVLLTARLSEAAGPAGIFRCRPEVLATQTGYPVAKVVRCLRALEPAWVEYEPPVLWIKNALRYDPIIHLSNPTQRIKVQRCVKSLPRLRVVLNFCQYYEITWPFDGPPPSPSMDGQHIGSREVGVGSRESLTTEALPAVRLAPDDAPAGWGQPEDLVALYNRLAPPGLPRVTRLSPGRRSKARQYLRAFPEREFWTRCFTELRFSRLLQGLAPSPGHEGFKGDFDWLLTRGKDHTENAVKTAEGKYRDTGLGVSA